MTRIEEKIKNGEAIGFLIFSCGECGEEVLVPHYSKIPSLICDCRKPMLVADDIILKNVQVDKKRI